MSQLIIIEKRTEFILSLSIFIIIPKVLYTKEGLPWEEVTLPDAQPVLTTITKMFALLDDHNLRLSRNQQTTDERYMCYSMSAKK